MNLFPTSHRSRSPYHDPNKSFSRQSQEVERTPAPTLHLSIGGTRCEPQQAQKTPEIPPLGDQARLETVDGGLPTFPHKSGETHSLLNIELTWLCVFRLIEQMFRRQL
jgi:hypothetical protein